MGQEKPNFYDDIREMYGESFAFGSAISDAMALLRAIPADGEGKIPESLESNALLQFGFIRRKSSPSYQDTLDELRRYSTMPQVAQLTESLQTVVSRLEQLSQEENTY